MDADYHPKKYPKATRFKKLYDENNYEKSASFRIPKKLHQIWIGGEVPKQFLSLAKTWEAFHPDWEYKLWTDKDLENFQFVFCERAFREAKTMGARVDIFRYEILYQEGGIYLDIDFECLRSLNPLQKAHDFFTCIGGHDYIANSVIGVFPRHPLMERILKILSYKKSHDLMNPWFDTGPSFFTAQVARYLKKNKTNSCVYPTRYFHPLPNFHRQAYRKGQLSKRFILSHSIPESFAVHYWAESWVNR